MKGGFQVQSRLATHFDEIRMEAMVAGASQSRRERDRGFDEIQRLARVCADLLERALPIGNAEGGICSVTDPEEMMQRPSAPDEPPARAIARIGRMIEETVAEAMAEHERKCNCRTTRQLSDEPPVRAIGSMTHYVNMVADRAAAAAVREHLRLHHTADTVVTVDELLSQLEGPR